MTEHAGPLVTINRSCDGCKFHRTAYYCVEDDNDCDSGFDHECVHGDEARYIGMSARTPDWCPLLAASPPTANAGNAREEKL